MQTLRAQIIPSYPEVQATEILIKYIHNELDHSRCEIVERAIQNCKACADLYENLKDAFDVDKNKAFENQNAELLRRLSTKTKLQVQMHSNRPKMHAIPPRRPFLTAISDDTCDCCGS